MDIFKFLIRASKSQLTSAVLIGMLGGAAQAGLIALINYRLSYAGTILSGLGWVFFGLALTLLLSNVTAQVLLSHLSQGAVFEMRMYLSRRILSAPTRRLEELGSPALMASLSDDVLVLTGALMTLPVICVHAATLTVCLVYLGWLSGPLLAALLGAVVVGGIIFQLLAARARRSFYKAREKQDSLFNHFRALTEGHKDLKLHRRRREAFLGESMSGTASSLRWHNVTGMTFFAAANGWGQMMFYTFIGLLLFVGLGPSRATPQMELSFTFTLLYIWGPLGNLMNMVPALSRANVSLKKIESLGLTLAQSGSDEAAGDVSEPPAWDRLELRGATHVYSGEKDDSRFTLGPLDLSFRPGELVFLVGGNGSGKTTLAKLLAGLYVPEQGAIYLDGEPVTDRNREQYRQLFSVVFSDFYLFESLLGLNAPDLDERARHYLGRLQLDHKVQVKDGVLSTITALSQGQRKRLALLTAYLEDRPIYIFDEWAADQDPSFKDVFYLELLPELKERGKMVLVITHDDRCFHLADRIIKLDYGQLAAPVAPPALLAGDGAAAAQSVHERDTLTSIS